MNPGRRIEWLTLAGFACALVVMTVLSGLALHQAQTFAQSAAAIAHSQAVLHNLEQLRAAVVSAESGQRGYLITGNAIYLEQYRRALVGAQADLDFAAQSAANDPAQSALTTQLASHFQVRLQAFERVIDAYRSAGFKVAQALIATNAGRLQSEQFHRILDEMSALVQNKLSAHQLRRQTAEVRLRYSILALAVVLLAVLSFIFVLVRRSIVAGREAERLLSRLNVTLETRVTERTVQLEERTQELEQRTRQLEERSLQLEQANQQLESFSYSVSHDLRAPLRAISGFAQILARRHRNELGDEARHFMDNIVQASAHMGRLIDDLLNYSRLGRRDLMLKPVPLDELFAEIAHFLQPRAAETGVEISIPGDLPAVCGDRTLLMQVFTNLLENALTYRRKDVSTKVTVTWKKANGHVIVSVADNGIGIATEHFEKIFSVFQRLHNQDEYPGTGIGLAVVSKALGMQGGAVRLESTVGVGSTFHVTLRAAEPKNQQQKELP